MSPAKDMFANSLCTAWHSGAGIAGAKCSFKAAQKCAYMPRFTVEKHIQRRTMQNICELPVMYPLLCALPAVALCWTGLQRNQRDLSCDAIAGRARGMSSVSCHLIEEAL